jgi:protein-tyrosine-phosphatase
MADAGIDISACRPKRLTAELLRDAGVTLVVTMGCGDKCPYGARGASSACPRSHGSHAAAQPRTPPPAHSFPSAWSGNH